MHACTTNLRRLPWCVPTPPNSLQLVGHIIPIVISITLVFRCRRWFWTDRIHHPSTFVFLPRNGTKPAAQRITAPAHVPIVVTTWSIATCNQPQDSRKTKKRKKQRVSFIIQYDASPPNHHNPPLSFSVGFFILSVNTNEWPSEPTRATAMYLCPFSHAMD